MEDKEHPKQKDGETSASGNPIYRYDDVPDAEFKPAFGNEHTINAVSDHIERTVGSIEMVFHEVVSETVHIDINWVKPSPDRPFHLLVTSGMSDLPMTVPSEFSEGGKSYVELCMLLPSDWPLERLHQLMGVDNDQVTEEMYWPIRWLKIIARFPHQYDTWIGPGHTIPNGEEAAPFADNTGLGCMLVYPSLTLGEEFFDTITEDGRQILFYSLVPIYREEMEFKMREGVDALTDKFDDNGIGDILDVNRRNVAKKKWWQF